MLKVGINGAGGRMGLALVRLVAQDPDLQLALAVDRPDHPQTGKDIGLLAGISKPTGVLLAPSIDKRADVMIDFSLPAGTIACLQSCQKNRIPLVIGTTGLDKTQLSRIEEASKGIACLVSPNMSPGANIMFEMAAGIAKRLGADYDIEISETHHRFKKDAPSGTARRLSENVSAVTGKQIPVHSLRLGDVVGDHTIVFGNSGERIELTHRVNSRDIFARGALLAAKFIADAKPGLYTMADALRNKE